MMNNTPYPLTKEQKLFKEVKDKEEKYNSLISSLEILLKDIEQGGDVKEELKSMIKYKRDYKQKISYEEYLEKNKYVAGFGNWLEKDGNKFLKYKIEEEFYKKYKS
jgi:hypothetical protein